MIACPMTTFRIYGAGKPQDSNAGTGFCPYLFICLLSLFRQDEVEQFKNNTVISLR